jgi:hypothetical protein
MAVTIRVIKLYNTIVAADQGQAELLESLSPGGEYKAVFTQERNPRFHRKAFALASIGFDAWDPPKDKEYRGRPIEKNFESFRNELTIQAGFYTPVFKVNGDLRLVPDSWSWAKTDQLKFEAMYSAFIDVILKTVLTQYSKDDLEKVVEEVLRLA